MINRKLVLSGMMAVVAAAWLAPGWCQSSARARLVRVVGTVQIQRGGRGGWITVSRLPHRSLYGNDHVKVLPKASATILIDGAQVKLRPGTHVVVPGPRPKETPRAASCIWAVVGKVFVWLIGARKLELGSENAIAAASGTKFALEVRPDGTTVLTVLDGSVAFYNALGKVVVGGSEQSTVSPGSAPSRPMRVDPSG